MKNIQTISGTLTVLQRLPSSYFGNPRYLIAVNSVCCKTAVDSSYGYSVTNFDGKQVEASIGTHYGSLTLNTLKGI